MFDDNDELSRMIDQALSSYVAEQEPRGLDRRVLLHVREGVTKRRHRLVGWFAIALAAACCTAFMLFVSGHGSQAVQAPPRLKVTPHTARVQQIETRPAAMPRPRAVRASIARSKHHLPKLNQFPAPTPMTNEERALMAVREHGATPLFANTSGNINPIQIEPLDIKPL